MAPRDFNYDHPYLKHRAAMSSSRPSEGSEIYTPSNRALPSLDQLLGGFYDSGMRSPTHTEFRQLANALARGLNPSASSFQPSCESVKSGESTEAVDETQFKFASGSSSKEVVDAMYAFNDSRGPHVAAIAPAPGLASRNEWTDHPSSGRSSGAPTVAGSPKTKGRDTIADRLKELQKKYTLANSSVPGAPLTAKTETDTPSRDEVEKQNGDSIRGGSDSHVPKRIVDFSGVTERDSLNRVTEIRGFGPVTSFPVPATTLEKDYPQPSSHCAICDCDVPLPAFLGHCCTAEHLEKQARFCQRAQPCTSSRCALHKGRPDHDIRDRDCTYLDEINSRIRSGEACRIYADFHPEWKCTGCGCKLHRDRQRHNAGTRGCTCAYEKDSAFMQNMWGSKPLDLAQIRRCPGWPCQLSKDRPVHDISDQGCAHNSPAGELNINEESSKADKDRLTHNDGEQGCTNESPAPGIPSTMPCKVCERQIPTEHLESHMKSEFHMKLCELQKQMEEDTHKKGIARDENHAGCYPSDGATNLHSIFPWKRITSPAFSHMNSPDFPGYQETKGSASPVSLFDGATTKMAEWPPFLSPPKRPAWAATPVSGVTDSTIYTPGLGPRIWTPSNGEPSVKSASEGLVVTYWITVESGDKKLHVPLRSNQVSAVEKDIVTREMQQVWQWAQDKGLTDRITLQDAYDLAVSMHPSPGVSAAAASNKEPRLGGPSPRGGGNAIHQGGTAHGTREKKQGRDNGKDTLGDNWNLKYGYGW